MRNAFRQIRANPGFSGAVIVTLALGIGVNTAVFSVVSALILQPLPVQKSEELIAIYSSGDVLASSPLSAADFNELEERCRSCGELAAYSYAPMALEAGGESHLVLGVRATAELPIVLGLEPGAGRLFLPDDSTEQALLSYRAWQRRFNGDAAVVGQTIRVNGYPTTIVGILPASFLGLARGVAPELWIPMSTSGAVHGEGRSLWVLGRRMPNAALAQVRAELRSVTAALASELPETHGARAFSVLEADRVRILPGVDATLQTASWAVMVIVALVLLVAGTNVANLLLARGMARRREIATRLALGARPRVIVVQLLQESLVLALAGGVLGLVIVAVAHQVLERLSAPLPVDVALGLRIDVRVLVFAFLVSTLSALIFGLVPALNAARLQLVEALRSDTPKSSPRRLGGLLVMVQVAASFALLLYAGYALRSLRNVHHVDLGFVSDGVAVATFAPRLQGRSDDEARLFYEKVLDEVQDLPQVESAAMTSHLPLTVELRVDRVGTDNSLSEDRWPSVDMALVSPDYFETLRIDLLSGRTLTADDDEEAPRVAIVNHSFAQRFWPKQHAVGQRLRIAGEGESYEVVGVVRDGKYRTLGETARPFLYRSLEQSPRRRGVAGELTTGSRTLVARGATPADLRRVAREIDGNIAFARLETLNETLKTVLFVPQAAAWTFSLFGLLALLLAVLGIYSLMTYTVSWRIREIGIRKALGATPRDVTTLVVRRALLLVGLGLAGGLFLAFAGVRLFTVFLYGVQPGDPVTLGLVAFILLAAAWVAAYVPARRAALLDAWASLRSE